MTLLFFVKSPVYVVMKVRPAAMVRCCGAGCRGTGFVGGTLLPFALDKLALVVVVNRGVMSNRCDATTNNRTV